MRNITREGVRVVWLTLIETEEMIAKIRKEIGGNKMIDDKRLEEIKRQEKKEQ